MKREELETAAAKYSYQRGLLALPLAAMLAVSALANAHAIPSWVFVPALVLAAAAAHVILRRYEDRYGRLNPSPRMERRATAAGALAIAIMVAGSFALRDAPVNAIAIPFALLMLAAYAVGVGLSPHHVVIWGALILTGTIWTDDNAGLAMAGGALALNGLLDHRSFTRRFGHA
jgi:hypothetical protein